MEENKNKKKNREGSFLVSSPTRATFEENGKKIWDYIILYRALKLVNIQHAITKTITSWIHGHAMRMNSKVKNILHVLAI